MEDEARNEPANCDRPNDYSRLSKAALIGRLQALEAGRASSGESSPAADPAPQHLAQAALRESEERMRSILRTAVEGIITIDERGVIELVNPAAERIFGYPAPELIGQNVSLLMPSPDREKHDSYIQNYVRGGQARIIGIGREVMGRRKDGTLFPMDLAVSEVRLAERRLFTGFVRDITERRRAELREKVQFATTRALAESTSLGEGAPRILQAIGETMGWGCGEFWSVDREADVIHYVQSWYPSPAKPSELEFLARRTTCRRGAGLPGRAWAAGQAVWIADLSAETNFLRMPAVRREGLRSAFAFPILLGRDVLGVMAFFTRQTAQPDHEAFELFASIGSQIGQFIERKRAESKLAELARTLAEKNKELETIVYVASHDLRSPLVNIQGFSQELSRACEAVRARVMAGDLTAHRAEIERLLSEDIFEAINYILAGVMKIDALLAGFLRFSRLGRAALRIERLEMNTLFAQIAQTMDFQIKTSGASLTIGKLPPCLGDAVQINQVFSNLLDNALKYLDPSRPGQITISGQVENGRSIYAVRDNGIGIVPEHQSKIFEIFHRLDPSAGVGEGLGLTIAQRMLERQNGKIWVDSALGKGSTFFVSLPAQV